MDDELGFDYVSRELATNGVRYCQKSELTVTTALRRNQNQKNKNNKEN